MTRHHHFNGNSGNSWSDPNNWDGGYIPGGWQDSSVSYKDGSIIHLTDNVEVNSLSFTGEGTLVIDGDGKYNILNNGNTTIDPKVTIVLDKTNLVGGDGHSSSGIVTAGTLVIKGSLVSVGSISSNIVFDNTKGPNTLRVNWSGEITGNISNLTPGDTIDLRSGDSWANSIEWVHNSDGSYRIVVPADSPYDKPTTLISHVTLAPGIKPSDFTWSQGELVCYLRGTPILTTKGYIPVENLTVGTSLVVFNNGRTGLATVTWTGWKKAVVDVSNKHDDFAGWPILIRAGAIADNVPSIDVRVTPEHCLYFDGHFVPARMLVNGSSILYDKTVSEYDYFHFETASHHIVEAAGMLSESFLDTGNKASFNSNIIGGSPPSKKTWADAAAPLNTHVFFVKPIWERIAARVGITCEEAEKKPFDIHLTSGEGEKIFPIRVNGDKVMFQIPCDVDTITINSDTARPSDLVGPYMDDRRELGVMIKDMTMFGRNTESVSDYLTNNSGWFDAGNNQRWTNGAGKVNIGSAKLTGEPRMLAIHVGHI